MRRWSCCWEEGEHVDRLIRRLGCSGAVETRARPRVLSCMMATRTERRIVPFPSRPHKTRATGISLFDPRGRVFQLASSECSKNLLEPPDGGLTPHPHGLPSLQTQVVKKETALRRDSTGSARWFFWPSQLHSPDTVRGSGRPTDNKLPLSKSDRMITKSLGLERVRSCCAEIQRCIFRATWSDGGGPSAPTRAPSSSTTRPRTAKPTAPRVRLHFFRVTS